MPCPLTSDTFTTPLTPPDCDIAEICELMLRSTLIVETAYQVEEIWSRVLSSVHEVMSLTHPPLKLVGIAREAQESWVAKLLRLILLVEPSAATTRRRSLASSADTSGEVASRVFSNVASLMPPPPFSLWLIGGGG